MSEKEKQIIQTLADKLPAMSERERGWTKGRSVSESSQRRTGSGPQ